MHNLTTRFELSRAGAGVHLRAMEGLRGYAVLLVFLVHYSTLISPWLTPSSAWAALAVALHTLGDSGVDLFFVLSGYLIYGSLIASRQAFIPYMRRRVMRIYPAYTAVFVLYLGLSLAMPQESKIPAAPLAGLLYIAQNYLLLNGLTGTPYMITVAWSLAYEIFFYLVLPPLIALSGLRRRGARWRRAALALATLALAAGCQLLGGPLRMLMFMAGMLLHESMEAPPRAGGLAHPCSVALALLAAACAMLTAAAAIVKTGLLFAALYLLLRSCLRQPQGAVARTCHPAPLRWLGNMSYSYYLLHGLALKAAFAALAVLRPPAHTDGWLYLLCLPPMLALTIVSSAALFLLVERPCSLVIRQPATPTVSVTT